MSDTTFDELRDLYQEVILDHGRRPRHTGRLAAFERLGRPLEAPPVATALGSLVAHITGGHLAGGKGSFQPMNINYGLMPPMSEPRVDAGGRKLGKRERSAAKKRAVADRALAELAGWAAAEPIPA